MSTDNDAGTVDRVLSLLRLVAETDGLMSIRNISENLSLAPSTVHRLLEKLAAHDLVFHDKVIHRYRLGSGLYRMAQIIVKGHPLNTLVEPMLQELARHSGEAAIFGLLLANQRKMIFSSAVDSSDQLRYKITLNTPITLATGASGRAILAYLPPDDITACIEEEWPGNAAKAKVIQQDLVDIRVNGYAFTRGERLPGAVGVAVPVFGVDNKVMGCLCITLPQQRYKPQQLKSLVTLLQESGGILSQMLGAPEEA